MVFDKYFFRQFKKEIEEENKKFEAKSEKKEVNFSRCPHKDVKFVNGELRCKCGVGWRGANLNVLFEKLTKRNII